jgi:hypothetical protein
MRTKLANFSDLMAVVEGGLDQPPRTGGVAVRDGYIVEAQRRAWARRKGRQLTADCAPAGLIAVE